MSSQYSRDHCKIAVSKILQTIGWHTVNSTPLEVLTDILSKYMQQISKTAVDYANEFGQTEVNLDHLGLSFQDMGVNLDELDEYVTYVNFAPGPHSAPKFPVTKENNLNFLKPGSKEVMTRPLHINEHLPPMYPLLEETENEEPNVAVKEEITIEETDIVDPQQFKKPTDFPPEMRKPKREEESSSRPTREISSVMMTTSGFLSPAREGKLPEAKAPAPPPPPEVPPPVVTPTIEPNVKKKSEKRKEKFGRELFKAEEKPIKKVPTMKDLVKMKQKSTAGSVTIPSTALPPTTIPPAATVISIPPNVPLQANDVKVSHSANPHKVIKDKMEKIDKALAAAKAKTEKLNTTITPIPMKSQHSPIPPAVTIQQVEKLFNEPDKKKVNIFKKISSKPKKDSRSATPNLIIDETTDIVNKINQLSSDITIEPIPPGQMGRNAGRMDAYFDGGSPRPNTPSIPRMSDIIGHHPPMQPQKRKRQRDPNRKIKRQRKNQQFLETSDFVDIVMDRPKTPESLLSHLRHSQAQMGLSPLNPAHIPFPFLTNFGGPGLIPSQLPTPMFPFSHFGGLPNFGKTPYFPPLLNMPPQMEPVPLISPKVKEPPPEYKPAEIIPQVVRPPPSQKPPPMTPTPGPARPATPVITPVAPPPPTPVHPPTPPIQVPETSSSTTPTPTLPPSNTPSEEDSKQKIKEHKKEKKDKIKKKNKKDKEKKDKSEKKKMKELKKDGKDKVKKEKKLKKKEKVVKDVVVVAENPIPKILLKVNSPSPRPETPETMKKLNIKPVVKRDEEPPSETNVPREPSPGGLAKISALVTGPPKPKTNLSPAISPHIHIEKVVPEEPPVVLPKTPGRPRLNPPKPKAPPKPKKLEQAFKKIDEQGNEVWICPACGQQDDGRPMIGCDGCDAWYHWVCVGIQVPPDENENWYCKPCLCKKNEDLQSDKKKKRKRKEKKEH